MKILILVISSKNSPYDKLEESIRKTWGNNEDDNIKIFYNYGDGESSFIDGDKIICNYPETLENIGLKTIKSFELLYDLDFDYIFRTNLSSFVDIKNMVKYLEDKPTDKYYAGRCGLNFGGEHLIKFGEGSFASGSGYFLSKDIVKLIIDNKEKWDHSIIDDVAIAGLLKGLNILPTNCPRIDITSTTNGLFYHQNDIIDDRIIMNNYHFRCKTFGDRTGDIIIFEELNKIKKKQYDSY